MRRQGAVHVTLLKLVPTRAAFAGPGRARRHFPGVDATTQPSDSPAPLGRRSGSPCARPATARTLLLGRTVRASANARRVGDWSSGLRTNARCTAVEKQGSPRLPGRPLHPRRGQRPRRVRRLLALQGRRRCCLQEWDNPWAPGIAFSLLCNPRLGSLAYLRINGDVATTAAGLATGLAGSPLAGRGSHP